MLLRLPSVASPAILMPPTGWSAFQDDVPANAGYVSVDRGRLDVVGAKAQISAVAANTTSVTVTYRNATASTTTGKASLLNTITVLVIPYCLMTAPSIMMNTKEAAIFYCCLTILIPANNEAVSGMY